MDIANIGFRVDTSDINAAVSALKNLKPAAAGATEAANKLANAAEGASLSVMNAAVATAKAEQSKAQATLTAAKATASATKEDIAAAAAEKRRADATYQNVKAQRDLAAAANAVAAANKRMENSALAAAGRQKQLISVFRDNGMDMYAKSVAPQNPIANDQMPNRFNTANIAAQFQDIGVTAAMGMNPLTIALQQGTQLSAILNTMEKPLEGIAIAFRSIINATSLLTMGFVALLAVGVQLVDWTKVAQGAMNGLANVIENFGPQILAFAGVLALIYAPAIISGIGTVATSIISLGMTTVRVAAQMAAAWVVAMGPIGWFIGGLALIMTAMYMFRDEISKILGVDIVKSASTGLNYIIGAFVGTYNGIVAVFKNLPAVMKGIFTDTGVTAAEVFSKAFSEAQGKDYVGMIGDKVTAGVSAVADKLREMAAGIGAEDKKKRGKTDAEKFDDIINGAERSIETLRAERDAIGLSTEAAARLKYETDLLNQAKQKNITLTEQQRAQIGILAGEMAGLEEQIRRQKDAWEFDRETTKGFFADMKAGLMEGKGFWETFGNAVNKVLDKIVDKLLNDVVDALFEVNSSASKGGGGSGGFLGMIGGWLGGLFSAKGNAFNSSGVTPYAKGGTFTNSIVKSPTLFAYANGGQFGVMGEAGPEAIMPLKRGSDGSLGVQVNGSNDNKPVVHVEVIVQGNATVQQERQTQTDGSELRRFIINVVNEGNAGGDFDSSNAARYNLAPVRGVR